MTPNIFGREADQRVTCIACGEPVPRSAAREYDKHGDRWTRGGKEFEFLCKPCHRECCHQPREGLEETLIEAEAGRTDRQTFLSRYQELVEEDASTKHRG